MKCELTNITVVVALVVSLGSFVFIFSFLGVLGLGHNVVGFPNAYSQTTGVTYCCFLSVLRYVTLTIADITNVFPQQNA